MGCRIEDLRDKQVICVGNGCVLGFVGDVEIDTKDGRLVSLIIFGRRRCFGLLGREEDIVIHWCDVQVIGGDTVLVRCDPPPRIQKKRGGILSKLGNGTY